MAEPGRQRLRRALSDHGRDSASRAWDVFWRSTREKRLAGQSVRRGLNPVLVGMKRLGCGLHRTTGISISIGMEIGLLFLARVLLLNAATLSAVLVCCIRVFA